MEDLEQEAFLAEMVTDDEAAPADAPAPVVEDVVEEVVEPVRKEVIAGYTEDELKEALSQIGKIQKSLDTANGTYGQKLDTQQKAIDELRQQRQQTVGGLTTDKLTRLSKEFPEIAEMLASDLSEYITQGAASFDPSIVEQSVSTKMQLVEERIAKKEQELEIRALTRAHRDWREVASFEQTDTGVAWKNPAFGKWVDGQPAEVKSQLLNSNDADYLSDRLTEFKAAIKPKVVNKEVIEAAVRPRGLQGKSAPDTELDEEAAYRAEMARR